MAGRDGRDTGNVLWEGREGRSILRGANADTIKRAVGLRTPKDCSLGRNQRLPCEEEEP